MKTAAPLELFGELIDLIIVERLQILNVVPDLFDDANIVSVLQLLEEGRDGIQAGAGFILVDLRFRAVL